MFSGKFLSENGIEYFRKNLGLSQEELAERSGLGDSTVSRIESAASYPLSIISLHRIAKALEAEPYQLLTFS
nr:helix-turn-helix transcriptional regulator [uncultured Oscillibacter sp.]